MSEKMLGTVKWFSRAKGYGFIQPDGSSEDVFVHYTAIVGEGFRNLERGQRVEFAIEDTAKGPQATEVTGLELEAAPEGPLAADVSEVELEATPEGPQATEVTGLDLEAAPEGPLAPDVSEVELEATPEGPLPADVTEVEPDQEGLDPSTPED
jgi:CspA family cold shock protein